MNISGASISKLAVILKKIGLQRTAAASLFIFLSFTAGYTLGNKEPPPPSFHDMIINHADSLSSLVTPEDSRVKLLAKQLQTPQNAYLYLRDSIAFDPSLPALPAGEIAAQKRASCLGKAVLLCSIYRAMGMSSNEVRVVTGEVEAGQGILDHAWVELEHAGKCLQQDSSDLLGRFAYDQFQEMAYTNAFIKREGYAFNDKGFAVISRLNMMKGSGHPVIIKGLQ